MHDKKKVFFLTKIADPDPFFLESDPNLGSKQTDVYSTILRVQALY